MWFVVAAVARDLNLRETIADALLIAVKVPQNPRLPHRRTTHGLRLAYPLARRQTQNPLPALPLRSSLPRRRLGRPPRGRFRPGHPPRPRALGPGRQHHRAPLGRRRARRRAPGARGHHLDLVGTDEGDEARPHQRGQIGADHGGRRGRGVGLGEAVE